MVVVDCISIEWVHPRLPKGIDRRLGLGHWQPSTLENSREFSFGYRQVFPFELVLAHRVPPGILQLAEDPDIERLENIRSVGKECVQDDTTCPAHQRYLQ